MGDAEFKPDCLPHLKGSQPTRAVYVDSYKTTENVTFVPKLV